MCEVDALFLGLDSNHKTKTETKSRHEVVIEGIDLMERHISFQSSVFSVLVFSPIYADKLLPNTGRVSCRPLVAMSSTCQRVILIV